MMAFSPGGITSFGAAADNAARILGVEAGNTTRTIMQSLEADLTSLLSFARANLDAASSQRGRLLRDMPPAPITPPYNEMGKRVEGDSVSFADLDEIVNQIRNTLLETNEHLLSLRRIG